MRHERDDQWGKSIVYFTSVPADADPSFLDEYLAQEGFTRIDGMPDGTVGYERLNSKEKADSLLYLLKDAELRLGYTGSEESVRFMDGAIALTEKRYSQQKVGE